jgi:membrane-bound ClpP family serine protease
MSWFLIITLIVIGLLFIVLEVLALPGGVAGIVGGALVVVGIVLTYQNYDAMYGHLVLAGTLVFSIIMVVVFIRSKTWKRFTLSDELKGGVNMDDKDTVFVGDKGRTISRLAPMGKVEINDRFYEVYTHGEFIDQNVQIEVSKIKENRIYVKQII